MKSASVAINVDGNNKSNNKSGNNTLTLFSAVRQLAFCGLFFSWILIFCSWTGAWSQTDWIVDPWSSYGTGLTIVLILIRMLSLLALPQVHLNA